VPAGERRGERLGAQVGGQLGVVRAASEEREHRFDVAGVEPLERRGIPRAQQLLVSRARVVHLRATSLDFECDQFVVTAERLRRRTLQHHAKETPLRTHSRRIWPPFAAVAVLIVVGLFVLDGAAAGVVLFFALLGVIGAAINALRGEKVYDGLGGIGGGTSF
jgi:hypothetical protein